MYARGHIISHAQQVECGIYYIRAIMRTILWLLLLQLVGVVYSESVVIHPSGNLVFEEGNRATIHCEARYNSDLERRLNFYFNNGLGYVILRSPLDWITLGGSAPCHAGPGETCILRTAELRPQLEQNGYRVKCCFQGMTSCSDEVTIVYQEETAPPPTSTAILSPSPTPSPSTDIPSPTPSPSTDIPSSTPSPSTDIPSHTVPSSPLPTQSPNCEPGNTGNTGAGAGTGTDETGTEVSRTADATLIWILVAIIVVLAAALVIVVILLVKKCREAKLLREKIENGGESGAPQTLEVPMLQVSQTEGDSAISIDAPSDTS